MPANRREPADRRKPSEFVRRAASQGETRAAVPHASLKRRAMGLMKQSLRTDLFRPASQPYDVEEVFVPRSFNFVEAAGLVDVPPPKRSGADAPKRRPQRPETDSEGRVEPRIDVSAEEDAAAPDEDDLDLDMPPASGRRPLEATQTLDLPDLEEYDGSDIFDQEEPDAAAEPAIPAETRTELPSALRNKRNYYENSDEARKGGLLGGIIPGSGRPAAKPSTRSGPKRR